MLFFIQPKLRSTEQYKHFAKFTFVASSVYRFIDLSVCLLTDNLSFYRSLGLKICLLNSIFSPANASKTSSHPYVYSMSAKSIPDRCPCGTSRKGCYIRDNLHVMFDVMKFQIIGCHGFSTFVTLSCATAIQNFKRL